MANTIKIKRSSVQGKVPTTSQLELGELAINTFDGKLYLKKDDGTAAIVEIGAGGGGSISTLSDVDTSSLQDTQFLQYDAANSQWVPATVLSSVETIIAPIAYAAVNNALGGSLSSGGLSWSTQSNSGTITFTFANAQFHNNYSINATFEGDDANTVVEVTFKSTGSFGISVNDGAGNAVAPTNNDKLIVQVFDINPTRTIGASGASDLSGLADVDTTGVSDGDLLIYDINSNSWSPAAPLPGPQGADGASIQGTDGASVQGTAGESVQGSQGTQGFQGTTGESIQGTTGESVQGSQGTQGPSSGGSALTLQAVTTGTPDTYDTDVRNVEVIQFDSNSGFNLTDEGSGTVFIDMGSTFNPWYVDGSNTLQADGEEPIQLLAGTGIQFTSDNTTGDKSLTITATGGGGSSAAGLLFEYEFSTSGLIGGEISFNNSNIFNTTSINIHTSTKQSQNIGELLLTIDGSDNPEKAYLYFNKRSDSSTFAVFEVTGNQIAQVSGANGLYFVFNVDNVTGSAATPFADGDELYFSFSKTGNRGEAGLSATSLRYQWSTQTNTGLSSGRIALNSTVYSTATQLNLSNIDYYGNTASGLIADFDNSNSAIKGYLRVEHVDDNANFVIYEIDGNVTSSGGDRYVPVNFVLQSGANFNVNALVSLSFVRNGDIGTQGTQGTQGIQGPQGVQGLIGPQEFTAILNVTANLNTYFIDGVQQPDLVLFTGFLYKFDTSDNTLLGNPFKFGLTDGNAYTGSLYFEQTQFGTPGQSGSYLQVKVYRSRNNIFYFNDNGSTGWGGSADLKDFIFENLQGIQGMQGTTGESIQGTTGQSIQGSQGITGDFVDTMFPLKYEPMPSGNTIANEKALSDSSAWDTTTVWTLSNVYQQSFTTGTLTAQTYFSDWQSSLSAGNLLELVVVEEQISTRSMQSVWYYDINSITQVNSDWVIGVTWTSQFNAYGSQTIFNSATSDYKWKIQLRNLQGTQGAQGLDGAYAGIGLQGSDGAQGAQGHTGNLAGVPYTLSSDSTTNLGQNQGYFNLTDQGNNNALPTQLSGIDKISFSGVANNSVEFYYANAVIYGGDWIGSLYVINETRNQSFLVLLDNLRTTGSTYDYYWTDELDVLWYDLPIVSNAPSLADWTNNDQIRLFVSFGSGTQGTDGVGLQGSDGQSIQGSDGQSIQGSQGIQGEKGNNGISVQGTDGESIQGSQGIQGLDGESANIGLQGLQGIQGPEGGTGGGSVSPSTAIAYAIGLS